MNGEREGRDVEAATESLQLVSRERGEEKRGEGATTKERTSGSEAVTVKRKERISWCPLLVALSSSHLKIWIHAALGSRNTRATVAGSLEKLRDQKAGWFAQKNKDRQSYRMHDNLASLRQAGSHTFSNSIQIHCFCGWWREKKSRQLLAFYP